MRNFEYARPDTEAEALEFLADHQGQTAVLAGGTDLMNLLRADLVQPKRVVDLKPISSLREITAMDGGVKIGALVTLTELARDPMLADYRSLIDVVDGVRAVQVQSAGTIGGDLCHLPNCWYFRNGYGLLGIDGAESLVSEGDNRYHAILGNQGPAKFVNASRFAPSAIAWNAKVRIIGPAPDQAEWVPLEYFYITPKTNGQGNTILKPGQLVSHVWLPDPGVLTSATYEVLQMQGLDWPLASASATLDIENGLVREARIVMGHVAPVPWVAQEAARFLLGNPVNDDTAGRAADMAVARATPLSMNEYKVQLARTAVKRAVLKAAGQWEGVNLP
ncbi:MAG: FAD binding domain-containing protein [Planctomycetaceae bacterium]|nr:FAD binding domain-containing protein [Planctomycetaceae bacterium]